MKDIDSSRLFYKKLFLVENKEKMTMQVPKDEDWEVVAFFRSDDMPSAWKGR